MLRNNATGGNRRVHETLEDTFRMLPQLDARVREFLLYDSISTPSVAEVLAVQTQYGPQVAFAIMRLHQIANTAKDYGKDHPGVILSLEQIADECGADLSDFLSCIKELQARNRS